MDLFVRSILVQLVGGESCLFDNESDFKLLKSAEGLEKYDLGEEFDPSNVVGYITSSDRLFVIEKIKSSNNDGYVFHAESNFQLSDGKWIDGIHYEYSEQFSESKEDLEAILRLLNELFN